MFTPYCMLRLYADLVPQLPDRMLIWYRCHLSAAVCCVLPWVHDRCWYCRCVGPLWQMVSSPVDVVWLSQFQRFADELLEFAQMVCALPPVVTAAVAAVYAGNQSALNKLAKCKRILPPNTMSSMLEPDTVFSTLRHRFAFGVFALWRSSRGRFMPFIS